MNPRFFFPKKAKFVSKKPMLTKMAPFGLMATILISMGLCSFAEIGSALRHADLLEAAGNWVPREQRAQTPCTHADHRSSEPPLLLDGGMKLVCSIETAT